MAKDIDPHRIDIRRFAEEAAELDASNSVQDFARLRAETTDPAAALPVQWHARGEMLNPQRAHPDIWLHLRADTRLPMVCQRCLLPVDVPVAVDRAFRFVADEATAAALDDEAEEDLLALSHSFDLLELIEDELLMELPVSPRHEVCPEPVKMSVADPDFDTAGEEKEHPFALLGQLKTGK